MKVVVGDRKKTAGKKAAVEKRRRKLQRESKGVREEVRNGRKVRGRAGMGGSGGGRRWWRRGR